MTHESQFTARIVPMGKHIFSLGIISYVLSFVCILTVKVGF